MAVVPSPEKLEAACLFDPANSKVPHRCAVLDGYTEMILSLLRATTLEEVIQRASKFMEAVLRPSPWGLFLVEVPGDTLKLAAGHGPRTAGWRKNPVPIHDGGIAEWVFQHRSPSTISPVDEASLRHFHHASDGLAPPRSMHAFPLTNGSDFQGLLLLVDIEETAPGLSRVAYQAMEILGTVLAAVLSRLAVQRELESLAFSDPLTGLPNRRVFQHQLRQEIDRSKRLQTPFCLVLLDLDKFKAVNDTFGHRIGDLVLKAFAEILRSVLRKSDTGARIGGDEFAILAIGTTQSEAENLVQRIRAEADRSPVTIDEDHRLTIAFSFGIQYGNSEDTEVLFEEADQALYRAKNSLYL